MRGPERLKVFISSPGDVEEERRRAAIVPGRLRREFHRQLLGSSAAFCLASAAL
jgi:hypothetical protein